MSSFDFTAVANPHAERLQRAFGELRLKMVNLANAVPDDRPDLMQRKEEWSRDWAKLVYLDANAIDGKTYGLSTALSVDEGALGRKAQQSYERSWRKRKPLSRRREGDSDADASGEEEVPTVVAPLRVQRAATTDAVGSKKVLKKDSDEPIVHLVPCEGCHKVKKPCVGRVAVACDRCKTNRKACKYATHSRGVAKVRAAARAKAKVAAGPSSVHNLIRRPKTTPLPTSPSAAEEEDEEGSEDEEEGESAEGLVVESWKRKERESEVSGDFDPLADTGFTVEDLLLEGRVRSLYAKMTTMQAEEDAPVVGRKY
ncbi:hypothetical protein DFJ58DRAFT_728217 [Suillus subalutaceus]|uniref:uncharacterized protein n=1 Tax=Suillus subalutaceus TaxID=48586 RepID=UPI001B870913|nr:uncharacterized protein DFJ58DRAFT_728217 [Suillus subalutaceus]KAG1853462.1 hypothetical protein DFJ58DRAFT_728217 [Suillus subalutaceus]